MRSRTVAAILITAGIGYVTLLYYFRVSETPAEQQFGATAAGEAAVRKRS